MTTSKLKGLGGAATVVVGALLIQFGLLPIMILPINICLRGD
jgi:hypothetical protein